MLKVHFELTLLKNYELRGKVYLSQFLILIKSQNKFQRIFQETRSSAKGEDEMDLNIQSFVRKFEYISYIQETDK